MRAIARDWSTGSDMSKPTGAEVTRACCSLAALVVVFLPMLLMLGATIRVTPSPQPSAVSTPAEPSAPGPVWTERLGRLDEAIQGQNVSRAVVHWHEAYGEAVRSRDWQALLDAGDRAARIDALMARPGTFKENARRSYLGALLRAHGTRSTAGIRGAADAFERLGDPAVASAARRMLPS